MGDPKGFLTLRRATPERQAVDERVRHWGEFYRPAPESAVRTQAARCMDCGVPFCQGDTGCPVRNVIPEWNGLVQSGFPGADRAPLSRSVRIRLRAGHRE